jgi:hypothetical protein
VSFCTSPARFAILGRDQCEARYYDSALFSPISSNGREGLVVEFLNRDFLRPGQEQRRMDTSRIGGDEPEQPQRVRGAASASAGVEARRSGARSARSE